MRVFYSGEVSAAKRCARGGQGGGEAAEAATVGRSVFHGPSGAFACNGVGEEVARQSRCVCRGVSVLVTWAHVCGATAAASELQVSSPERPLPVATKVARWRRLVDGCARRLRRPSGDCSGDCGGGDECVPAGSFCRGCLWQRRWPKCRWHTAQSSAAASAQVRLWVGGEREADACVAPGRGWSTRVLLGLVVGLVCGGRRRDHNCSSPVFGGLSLCVDSGEKGSPTCTEASLPPWRCQSRGTRCGRRALGCGCGLEFERLLRAGCGVVWCGVAALKRGEVGAGSRGRCQNLGWCGLETEQVFTVQ